MKLDEDVIMEFFLEYMTNTVSTILLINSLFLNHDGKTGLTIIIYLMNNYCNMTAYMLNVLARSFMPRYYVRYACSMTAVTYTDFNLLTVT